MQLRLHLVATLLGVAIGLPSGLFPSSGNVFAIDSASTLNTTGASNTSSSSSATPTSDATGATNASPRSRNLPHGVRFLYQNDLDWNRAADASRRQKAYLLLTRPQSYSEAVLSCLSLGEQLASSTDVLADTDGLPSQFSFLAYEGSLQAQTQFWVFPKAGGAQKSTTAVLWNGKKIVTPAKQPATTTPLQALCTQSAPWSSLQAGTDSGSRWTVEATSNQLVFSGYRDSLSFRFQALKYAETPQRFAQSTVLRQQTGVVTGYATDNSSACPQGYGAWKEDCLLTSVFTTYLPSQTELQSGKAKLRPVVLWIHGGGFSSGSGLDPNFLGGQLASRSDIVVVTPNYRLGMLGQFAVNGDYPGNQGFGDLVTALRWVQQHAAAFGGDKNNVMIFGQSAGANMVEDLLASPAAAGLFHASIIQSGWPLDAQNAKSTTQEAAAGNIAKARALGCSSATMNVDSIVACLRALPPAAFLSQGGNSKPVVDGRLLTSRQLDVRSPGTATGHVNRVPTVMGYMRDELGSLGTVPATGLSLSDSLQGAGVSDANAQIVLANPSVFPVPPASNGGNQNLSVTVATDVNDPARRCGTQATLYALAKNGVMPSIYGYSFQNRAYQIPWYDPYGYCAPTSADKLSHGTYGMCHSGDLLPLWNTYGWYGYQYRDASDLPFSRAIADQWSAFARWHSPVVRSDYLSARRTYDAPSSSSWHAVDASGSSYQILALGAKQYMAPLESQKNQCNAFNRSKTYILDNIAANGPPKAAVVDSSAQPAVARSFKE